MRHYKPYDRHPEVEREQTERLQIEDKMEKQRLSSAYSQGWSPLHRKQQKYTTEHLSAGIAVGHKTAVSCLRILFS